LSGLWKIRVCAVGHGMWVAVRKLAMHGGVARLLAIVGLERTLAAVGIVFERIDSVVGHG